MTRYAYNKKLRIAVRQGNHIQAQVDDCVDATAPNSLQDALLARPAESPVERSNRGKHGEKNRIYACHVCSGVHGIRPGIRSLDGSGDG
jgi:hypothetical protein